MTQTYDPNIKARVLASRERRENPEENRELLVPYGIRVLDKNFYGIGVDRGGELVLLIAEEKNRKTTLVINIIINVNTDPYIKHRPAWVIDTLESGMNEDRYTDAMIVNLASRHLIAKGHVPLSRGFCKACGKPQCQELVLTPEYIHYHNLTSKQAEVVTQAEEEIMTWPVKVYGAALDRGDTRNLPAAVDLQREQYQQSRWLRLRDEGYDIFITDHVQQYRFGIEHQTDYEKMIRSMNRFGDFVASTGAVVFAVSQVSLTSIREAKSGGKLTASGGRKGHQEATKIISTDYEPESGSIKLNIEGSRVSGLGFSEVPLDDVSGAMYELN